MWGVRKWRGRKWRRCNGGGSRTTSPRWTRKTEGYAEALTHSGNVGRAKGNGVEGNRAAATAVARAQRRGAGRGRQRDFQRLYRFREDAGLRRWV
ncbi:hypothetical protein SESBI_43365 [Sesbania bispinosa]|nr:hypothetical protein SESBI_43365 [Sesbania bispinosa]